MLVMDTLDTLIDQAANNSLQWSNVACMLHMKISDPDVPSEEIAVRAREIHKLTVNEAHMGRATILAQISNHIECSISLLHTWYINNTISQEEYESAYKVINQTSTNILKLKNVFFPVEH